MKRVLFVDDDAQTLEGLRNLMRPYRAQWEMDFVDSGALALDRLKKAPCDVMVADMHMPRMDGPALLKAVKDQSPQTVRIVLSGYTDVQTAMRAVAVAHQFLAKPCDPALLKNVIERSCSLHELINDASLRQMLGKIDNLPSLPHVYSAVMTALADPKTSAEIIARIIEKDVAMSAKLLQLVNSAFFGLPRKISSIKEALLYLGFEMVKNLLLTVEVFKQGDASAGADVGFSIERLQAHAFATANLARSIVADRRKGDDAFLAALLHDVGELVLATKVQRHYVTATARAAADQTNLWAAERIANGLSHAEIGACLLGMWGLPYSIVEAVLHHHQPGAVQGIAFDVLAAVHVANALSDEYGVRTFNTPGIAIDALDVDYLRALGVEDKIDGWRVLAKGAADKA